MIVAGKISVELIVLILLYLALITTHEESTKIVFKLTVLIAILAIIAMTSWWF